jgi:hypothetical protein
MTAISKTLMLAILSMDSYQRGYGAGIILPSQAANGVGNATVFTDSTRELDLAPTSSAGFYAAAYTINNSGIAGLDGKTIISYRGTDNSSLWSSVTNGGSDIINGWLVGAGTLTAQSSADGDISNGEFHG